jgi:hypothetical protein
LWASILGCLAIAISLAFWLVRRQSQTATIRSLAVLPLANLSGDPNQEYFAEGMTDELITELASIPNLRVVSRTSVSGGSRSIRYARALCDNHAVGLPARRLDGISAGTDQRTQSWTKDVLAMK